MDILKRCPFCGSEKVETKILANQGLDVAIVYCFDCGGQQRSLGSMESTIRMWNSRRGVKMEELNAIKSFILKADLHREFYCNQLCSLWTAYCIRHNLEIDTMVYNKDLEELWHAITTSINIWNSINDFKSFMAKWLTRR